MKGKKEDKKRNQIKIPKKFSCMIAIVFGIVLLSCMIRVDTVHIIGNNLYTAEEIKNDLFSGKETQSFLSVFRKKELPYLKEYKITVENYHTITVTVQEKEIFGGIDSGGAYAYIDANGMVLRFEEEKREDVSIIEGLYVTKVILHEVLETKDLDRLPFIQRVQTLLKQHEIIADVIYCSPQRTFRINLGTIQVFLGDTSELEEKINVFVAMLPALEGLSGNLYLDEYNSQNSANGYRFESIQK